MIQYLIRAAGSPGRLLKIALEIEAWCGMCRRPAIINGGNWANENANSDSNNPPQNCTVLSTLKPLSPLS